MISASYFNGINVVALATLADHVAQANKRTAKPVVADLADLQTVVRLAATAKLDEPAEAVWARATLGELHLGLGRREEALDDYEQATADPQPHLVQHPLDVRASAAFSTPRLPTRSRRAGRGAASAKTGGTAPSLCADSTRS